MKIEEHSRKENLTIHMPLLLSIKYNKNVFTRNFKTGPLDLQFFNHNRAFPMFT
jgi:hypothetical protein